MKRLEGLQADASNDSGMEAKASERRYVGVFEMTLMLTVPVPRLPYCSDATLGPPVLHATARCAFMDARLPPASVDLRIKAPRMAGRKAAEQRRYAMTKPRPRPGTINFEPLTTSSSPPSPRSFPATTGRRCFRVRPLCRSSYLDCDFGRLIGLRIRCLTFVGREVPAVFGRCIRPSQVQHRQGDSGYQGEADGDRGPFLASVSLSARYRGRAPKS